MKVLKALLALTVVLALTGAAAYLVGQRVGTSDPRAVAAHRTDHGIQVPSTAPSSTPPTPTTAPTTAPTSGPATPQRPPVTIVLAPGAEGLGVRELQQRLHQLAWLPETTTGVYDAATVAAVNGFQGKHGLGPTGRLDSGTWARLVAMTTQPTHDEMFNVLHPGPALLAAGDRGDDVRALQARLRQIAWYFGDVTGSYDTQTVTAVKGFQSKRGFPVTGEVDQRTLDRLAEMTTTPTKNEKHNLLPSPGRLDPRCLTGRVMCIDKTSSTLRWVVDGHVRQTMDARFGSTISNTPTREGLFHVYLMDADHVSRLYGSSMPYAMFFSGGQAVHYSSDFATVGYAGASHGCVNIRDYDGVRWLFSQVRVGDKVVVYWS
jgi:peptidoglycan hydrolase-like protein with peptidoglycan-binding domain